MALSHFESAPTPVLYNESLHLRETAEAILANDTCFQKFIDDPRSLPVAGTRVFYKEGDAKNAIIPTEVLSETYKPVVIFDLDDTVWPHVEIFVRAVSEASGVPITMEQFRKAGHTRKVPQWADNSDIMRIHDQILKGEHPTYYPFVNKSWPMAVKTTRAVHLMGHNYSYLTARLPELFETTLKTMHWNGILFQNESGIVNPMDHDMPKKGHLYCTHCEPSSVNEFKLAVMKKWLGNLRANGWQGDMVIIDDLLKPFQNLVESGEIIGIAPTGDLNVNFEPFSNEIRVNSWYEIADMLTSIHERAVTNDPSAVRIFDCSPALPDVVMVVNKAIAGTGRFTVEEMDPCAYTFQCATAYITR